MREYWLLNKKFATSKLREGDQSLVLVTLGVLFCFAATAPLSSCPAVIVYPQVS